MSFLLRNSHGWLWLSLSFYFQFRLRVSFTPPFPPPLSPSSNTNVFRIFFFHFLFSLRLWLLFLLFLSIFILFWILEVYFVQFKFLQNVIVILLIKKLEWDRHPRKFVPHTVMIFDFQNLNPYFSVLSNCFLSSSFSR